MDIKTDVLIVGSGVAGLYCALNLPSDKEITVITKSAAEKCDSYLAQGGISVLKDESDYEDYFEDTLRAGHYENDHETVEIMIRSSKEVIDDLISFGVKFSKDEEGRFSFTKEGAHSSPRILFHDDITGEEITGNLLAEVRSCKNIRILEYVTMLDILTVKRNEKEVCKGIVAVSEHKDGYSDRSETDSGLIFKIEADNVVWACGGIGGLYENSTNYDHLTGDAIGISLKHDICLKDIDYVQIHPTTLYTGKQGRAFLISESVRGEGGILLNDDGERFVDELLPRDKVTDAIHAEMKKTGKKHVWLSMENIPKEEIKGHFHHIYEECLKAGYDCTREPIPVVPAQHYFMGGVYVDKYSKTSMENLYAVGEVSCNGVHGANRLASNSLLESLVFAKRAAHHIAADFSQESPCMDIDENIILDREYYKDIEKIFDEYKKNILKAIERSSKDHEQNNDGTECGRMDIASA